MNLSVLISHILTKQQHTNWYMLNNASSLTQPHPFKHQVLYQSAEQAYIHVRI